MEEDSKIMLLFSTVGILHGISATHIINSTTNGGILMLTSIALVLYILTGITEKYTEKKEFKQILGPGIWPYTILMYATWVITINL
jgi:hypothetical protein